MEKSINEKEQCVQTDVICCGTLEKMNIDWMITDEGVKLMPFIYGEGIIKYRVNFCPCCGKGVRNAVIKP